jgi:hypothetical protein
MVVPEPIVDEIEGLHAEVDAGVAPLVLAHQARLRCGRGCSGCCVDGLTVFEVEAARILRHHAQLLAYGNPGPVGACAFLDGDGGCRVYTARPYVCRTQGLPLRWMEGAPGEPTGDEAFELRDICPLNADDGPPVETLAADECWTIGPFEDRLARLQVTLDAGQGRRVRLRDLFVRR